MNSAMLAAVTTAIGAAGRTALDWFYPRHCYGCGACLHECAARLLCGSCAQALGTARLTDPACEVCGLPLAGAAAGTLCTACRARERHFDSARALVAYGGPAQALIHAFKFEGEFHVGPLLLRLMAERGWLPAHLETRDVVVPVPLHPWRRRERGYDQGLLLAREVARIVGAPLAARALARTRYTGQQSLLSASRRWDNVRGAFAVRRPGAVAGRSVLLVDDVMTSGSTCDECARVLKAAGAAQVHAFTLARPLP